MTGAANRTARRRLPIVFGLMILCLAPAAPASGAAERFIPRFDSYEGDVELGFKREHYANIYGGGGMNTDSTTTREKVRLAAVGYVYHPRFILFSLRGAAGVEQQQIDHGLGSVNRSARSLEEYDFRAVLLPEHPYNLELFYSRIEPVTRNAFAPAARTVTEERGAMLRYRRRPVFADLSLVDIAMRGEQSVDSRTARGNASYDQGPMNTAAGFSRTATDSELSSGAVQERTYALNELRFPSLQLTSRIDEDRHRQTSLDAGSLRSDAFTWSEQLQATLPAGFRASGSISRQRSSFASGQAGALDDAVSRTASSGALLNHQLYESLLTELGFNRIDSITPDGSTTSQARSLLARYQKKIPSGRLSLGISLREARSERSGAPQVAQEPHTAAIGGDFFLNAQQADPASVTVRVLDPASQTLTLLVENVHYALQAIGAGLRVSILALPPSFTIGTPYEFTLSYSLVAAQVTLDTMNETYTLQAELQEGRLSPYLSHSVLRQDVVAGSFAGRPEAGASDTVGVRLRKGALSFSCEYTDSRYRVNPLRSWKSLAEAHHELSPGTEASASVSFDRTAYRAGADVAGAQTYTEELRSLSASIRKRAPRTNMTLSSGVSYANRRSTVDTDTAAVTAGLLWKLGYLTVTASASMSRAVSETFIGRQTAEAEYYSVTVTRKLF